MARQDTGIRVAHSHVQLFAQDESAPVRWRLLGGNNRELGRGAVMYEDRESCCMGVKHLQSIAAELDQSVQRTGSSTWVWQLSLEGALIASSGHRYDRLIRCRQGLTHFVAEFATCEIGPGLMLSQARRWSSASTRAVVEPRGRL